MWTVHTGQGTLQHGMRMRCVLCISPFCLQGGGASIPPVLPTFCTARLGPSLLADDALSINPRHWPAQLERVYGQEKKAHVRDLLAKSA